MIIDMDLLESVYDEAVRKGTICYINDEKEPEDITFDEFKDYIVCMVQSNLQYDLNITQDLNNLIKEVDE